MSQVWPALAVDTGWVEVTAFEGGWSVDPGWPVFVRRIGSRVVWKGQLTGGAEGAALVIPEGFRPAGVGTGMYWAAVNGASPTATTRVAVHGALPTRLSLIAGTRPNLSVVEYSVT